MYAGNPARLPGHERSYGISPMNINHNLRSWPRGRPSVEHQQPALEPRKRMLSFNGSKRHRVWYADADRKAKKELVVRPWTSPPATSGDN